IGCAIAATLAITRARQVRTWNSYPARVVETELALRQGSSRRPPEEGYGVRVDVSFLRDGKRERRLIEPTVFTSLFPDAAHEAHALRRPGEHRLFINPANDQEALLDPHPSF